MASPDARRVRSRLDLAVARLLCMVDRVAECAARVLRLVVHVRLVDRAVNACVGGVYDV